MKPKFIYNKFIPFGKFTAITILFWVFVKMRRTPTGGWYEPRISDRLRRHETYHAWQQVCLLALGLAVMVVLAAFGFYDWWVWLMPLLAPFGTYVLCWLIEIILPPYNSAYKDICFEGEAQYNEQNLNPKFIPFSFLLYIRNKNWRELGITRFLR